MDEDLSARMGALLKGAPEEARDDLVAPVRARVRGARWRGLLLRVTLAVAVTLVAGAVLSFGYGFAARVLPPLDAEHGLTWLPVLACGALVVALLREALEALASR